MFQTGVQENGFVNVYRRKYANYRSLPKIVTDKTPH